MTPDLADTSESWPVTSSRDLFRGDRLMALRADLVRRPGAEGEQPFERWVLEHPGAVIVLAVDDQERVCCLRQYRHAVGGRLVELPAGLRDTDEDHPLETARRELREEAELEAREWRHLFDLYPSAGITDERQVCFLARDLTPAGRGDFALAHEEADMELMWVPVDELADAVLDGRVSESPVAACVLAYLALRQRGAL
jgi:8-oxo-dGTP pyrophosphatase MutT (NUDIX family)